MSNCGNLQDQPPHAKLLNSSGLFLDFSSVTAYPETTDSGLPTARSEWEACAAALTNADSPGLSGSFPRA